MPSRIHRDEHCPPTAAQRGLKRRQREPLALKLDRDRREQTLQPILQWRQALARGLCLSARFLVTTSLMLSPMGFSGSGEFGKPVFHADRRAISARNARDWAQLGRRPRYASLSDRNCRDFCGPGILKKPPQTPPPTAMGDPWLGTRRNSFPSPNGLWYRKGTCLFSAGSASPSAGNVFAYNYHRDRAVNSGLPRPPIRPLGDDERGQELGHPSSTSCRRTPDPW